MTAYAFEVLGLSLTTMGVFLAVCVVYLWRKNTLKHILSKHKTPATWVTLGVFTKHFFDIADNGYWFTAWAGHFLNGPWTGAMMGWGFIANIPFRNIPLIVASFCYLMAYYTYREQGTGTVKRLMRYSFYVGAATAVVMVVLKLTVFR